MKGKSKIVYMAAAAVVLLALYLLVGSSSTETVSTFAKDVNRFGPDSIDVQMGMGTFRRDPPYTYASQPEMKPLLLFPPSETDLAKLSGPPTVV